MQAQSSRTPRARVARLAGRAVRGLLAAVLLGVLLAAVPWALIRGVGWPLPDRPPSPDEIGSVLMAPMSARFLLDALACAAWLLWLVFALDVAACAFEVARGARWRQLREHAGPVRRVAAALVGALLVAVVGRTADAAPLAFADAVRPAGHAPAASASVASAVLLPGAQSPNRPRESAGALRAERVRPPENGVHDSLWRIAQRLLGDGDRWPEIWILNQGSSQPGGRILTNPNLIHPGDTLRVPATGQAPIPPAPPPRAAPAPPAPHPAAPQSLPAPAGAQTPAARTPAGRSPAAAPAASEPAGGAVGWGGGEVFVSLGLAAAVSALLVLTRRRHHARYRPGRGQRDDPDDDLPAAPVVYQLRLAHLRAQHHDEDAELAADADRAMDDPASHGPCREPGAGKTSTAPAGPGTEGQLTLLAPRVRRVVAAAGPRGTGTGPATLLSVVDFALDPAKPDADGATAAAGDGTQVALDLARVHGLGLVGPGSYAAVRALLLTLLASSPRNAPVPAVYVPTGDVARLLGVPGEAADLPRTIIVTADLDAALDALDTPSPPRPAVLVTTPPRDSARQVRLQHLIDNEARHGLTALLLGQWRAGVTAYVTADGIVSATDPGLGEPLRGTRAFTLPETATRDLLAFLRAAAPDVSAAAGTDPFIDALEHPEVIPRSDAAVPASDQNGEGGPRHLEITAGTPAPEQTPAMDCEPGDVPHERAACADRPTIAPLALTVFGAPVLHWRPSPEAEPRDLSGHLSSRPTELLVFLAVHPAGVSRDAIVDALWPDAPPRNPASVLRTILSRIRRALDTATRGAVSDPVLTEHGQYRLDPAAVETDYGGFAAAVARRRAAGTAAERADACDAIVAYYAGALADGLDSDWLVAARQATRRDALDAVAALARARVQDDPDYTLDLLETARAFDPHNELLYRDIMRLQHALGRHDAISRTLGLLRTRLAEIDAAPAADTVDLARRLRARDTGIPVEDIARPAAT